MMITLMMALTMMPILSIIVLVALVRTYHCSEKLKLIIVTIPSKDIDAM